LIQRGVQELMAARHAVEHARLAIVDLAHRVRRADYWLAAVALAVTALATVEALKLFTMTLLVPWIKR
jgi:hypothetical protein